jgi:hypothetical protein
MAALGKRSPTEIENEKDRYIRELERTQELQSLEIEDLRRFVGK